MRFFPVKEIRRLPDAPVAEGAVRSAADAMPRFEVAVSSEYEVTRDFFGYIWREVLDHSTQSVNLKRFTSGAANVLEEHRGAPVGVIESARLDDDKVLRAIIRFSRSDRAQEVQQDIEDGIRSNISVGYLPTRAVKVEENADLGDLWRMTAWEPMELSVVGVPADPTVGVGRDGGREARPPVIIEDGTTVEEGRKMKKVRDEKGAVIEVADDDPRAAVVPETRSVEQALEARNKEVAEISAISELNGVGKHAEDWLKRGLTPGQVAIEILKLRKTEGTAQPNSETLELSEKDRKAYSYARAITGAANLAEGGKFEGLEAEVHQELVRLAPPTITRRGGVMVPMRLGSMQARTLASPTVGKGMEVVFEQQGELITLLRNYTAVVALGARTLSGLTAPIAFPKQTGAMTAFWVGENPGADVADSDVALGLALLAPKTLMASAAYSRQLLLQASIDVEGMVREELALIHAIAIDRAAIHGLASAGEPTGIYKAVGVTPSAIGGAMSYAKMLTMQGLLAGLNAYLGTLGWLMHPTIATNLRGLLDFPAAAAGRPIWTGTYQDGQAAGYKAVATNQISSTMTGSERTGGTEIGNIFGNWNDLIIGSFGALELIVDPYRLKKQGIIEVTSFQMCDILVRRGESFVKTTGATS